MNTFHDAGPTWTGSSGRRSRIDYICMCTALSNFVRECSVCDEIDLATALRDDHNVLLAQVVASTDAKRIREESPAQAPEKTQRGHKRLDKDPYGAGAHDSVAILAQGYLAPRAISYQQSCVRYTKDSLQEPARISYFQRLLEDCHVVFNHTANRRSACLQIDHVTADLVQHFKWAASQAFVPLSAAPKKSWISGRSWGIIRSVSTVRSQLRKFRRNEDFAFCSYAFLVWKASTSFSSQRRYEWAFVS